MLLRSVPRERKGEDILSQILETLRRRIRKLRYYHFLKKKFGRVWYREYVKSVLVIMATRFGVLGVPNATIPINGKKVTFDVLWVEPKNKFRVLVAFEVNGTVRRKSIEKLSMIQAKYRVIVSYTRDRYVSKYYGIKRLQKEQKTRIFQMVV